MLSLRLRAIDLASNSCEIADKRCLRSVSRDWRIVFDLDPLELELEYIERKNAGYFASSHRVQGTHEGRAGEGRPTRPHLRLSCPSDKSLRVVDCLCIKHSMQELF